MPCQRVFMLIKEVHINGSIKNALLKKSKRSGPVRKEKKAEYLPVLSSLEVQKTYSYLIISMLNIIFSKTVY